MMCGPRQLADAGEYPALNLGVAVTVVSDPRLILVRPVAPRTPQGCVDCLRLGASWVHLRLCLTCGHIGCCDSSPLRHAAATRMRPGTRSSGHSSLTRPGAGAMSTRAMSDGASDPAGHEAAPAGPAAATETADAYGAYPRLSEGHMGRTRNSRPESPIPRGTAWRRSMLETSQPGVFAAGDVRSGSTKRAAAGVGEGAMAIRLAHARIR
jgi:hypothetical protein